jgi:hypothetical protein
MQERRSRMASSELRRPKSANPNRRLRTATHKVTDPRVRPDPLPTADREEEFNYNLNESCPLSVWNTPDSLEDIDEPPGQNRSSASTASKQQRQTPSPTSSSSTYDSLMTFECIQKASALRVLAKTLDRQRDVLQQSSGANGSNTPGESATNDSRKTTPPPRKLRPLGREYSGPF